MFWQDLIINNQEQYGDDDELNLEKLKRERFYCLKNSSFSYIYEKEN